MKKTKGTEILARIPSDQFVGRANEIETLLRYARAGRGPTLPIAKAPGSGATELLLQVYDQLFRENGEVIPIYLAVNALDSDPLMVAQRFKREILTQIIAFRRNEPSILNSNIAIAELIEMAVSADIGWIEGFSSSVVRLPEVLAAPLRFSRLGARVLVMIDDIENIVRIPGVERTLVDLIEINARSQTPYILAGARRFVFPSVPGKSIIIENPKIAECAEIATIMSKRYSVGINEQTRDLIAVQMSGNLTNMNYMFAAAAERHENLDSFSAVAGSYAQEIFGGRLSLALDKKFDEAVPEQCKPTILELMKKSIDVSGGSLPRSVWRRACRLEDDHFRRMMETLHVRELVNCSASTVKVDTENHGFVDYVAARSGLEAGTQRALVYGKSLSHYITRGSQLLGRFYRRNAAIGLKDLLNRFDGQKIAVELLDYRKFREQIKGLSTIEASAALENSKDVTALPHIEFVADTAAFYPSLKKLIDDERSAIAIGFEENSSRERAVWIAAEIESKLEVDTQLAEFWCDRLEMAASNCGFDKFTIWMVSPEGFSASAVDILRSRNAVGSSHRQVELLRQAISKKSIDFESIGVDDYELIIPMGKDTEMIAARTLEDIARKHEFPSKFINQLKTALVEACINACEHSLSPDRRIYQKFKMTERAVEITVSNRGLRLQDRLRGPEATKADERRGWGLKLMRTLMDEVRIETVDDGTRITMVKYLRPDRLPEGD
jgi:serine/threonine-protein kinase RsbW